MQETREVRPRRHGICQHKCRRRAAGRTPVRTAISATHQALRLPPRTPSWHLSHHPSLTGRLSPRYARAEAPPDSPTPPPSNARASHPHYTKRCKRAQSTNIHANRGLAGRGRHKGARRCADEGRPRIHGGRKVVMQARKMEGAAEESQAEVEGGRGGCDQARLGIRRQWRRGGGGAAATAAVRVIRVALMDVPPRAPPMRGLTHSRERCPANALGPDGPECGAQTISRGGHARTTSTTGALACGLRYSRAADRSSCRQWEAE